MILSPGIGEQQEDKEHKIFGVHHIKCRSGYRVDVEIIRLNGSDELILFHINHLRLQVVEASELSGVITTEAVVEI